jgi:antitoxin component HigA of HigAB toxin-antitoxin module
VTVAAGALWAQDAAAPAEGAKAPAKAEAKAALAWWIDQVGLSDKQKEDIKAVLTAAKEAAAQAVDAPAKMQILQAAMEKIQTTILTEEQRAKLQELRYSLVGIAQERLQAMAQQFGITDEQIAAARDILKAAAEQAKAAQDFQTKIKIFADALEKIRTTVLTDEQRAKMEEVQKQMRERLQQLRQRMQERRAATGGATT